MGIRVNGAPLSLSSSGADPGLSTLTGPILLGANAAGGGAMQGSTAEVVVFPSALSLSDIQVVESYLRTRYGYY
jgi:hypothetical protein